MELSQLFYGFIMAYIGLLPPGMINMTTVRTTIREGRKQGILFALGASVIVALHAFIAFRFADYLIAHPEIINRLKLLGIFVLLGLSIYFLTLARKTFTGEGKENAKSPFISGFIMSSFNMLGIPFYLGTSSILVSQNLISLDTPEFYYLVIGATLGAFGLFCTYSLFADFITRRVSFIARNINYILSIVFLILAVIVLLDSAEIF